RGSARRRVGVKGLSAVSYRLSVTAKTGPSAVSYRLSVSAKTGLSLPMADSRQREGIIVHIVKKTERAVVAAVFTHGADTEAEMAELHELVATAGAEIVAEVTQERAQPHPVTYMGKGKLDELLGVVKEEAADLVIVDADLSP